MSNKNRDGAPLGVAAIKRKWLHSSYRLGEVDQSDVMRAKVMPLRMHHYSICHVILRFNANRRPCRASLESARNMCRSDQPVRFDQSCIPRASQSNHGRESRAELEVLCVSDISASHYARRNQQEYCRKKAHGSWL
jgi:hypothetical protein